MSQTPSMLVSVVELGQHIGKTIGSDTVADAEEAIRAASAAVNHAASRHGETAWTQDTVPGIARLICLRCASRLLTNPEQRTTFNGPDGLSFAGSPTRILTQEEREDLAPFRSDRSDMQAIRMRPIFG